MWAHPIMFRKSLLTEVRIPRFVIYSNITLNAKLNCLQQVIDGKLPAEVNHANRIVRLIIK
jgi:hypothetical protein